MMIKICRKEAKESSFWLKLTETKTHESERRRRVLIDEALNSSKSLVRYWKNPNEFIILILNLMVCLSSPL